MFDDSLRELSQCNQIADQNSKICENLLTYAKNIKSDLENAQRETEKDEKIKLKEQEYLDNIEIEIKTLKQKLEENDRLLKKQQEHENKMLIKNIESQEAQLKMKETLTNKEERETMEKL